MAAKELRVDPAALRAMSAGWVSLAGELRYQSPGVSVSGGSCSSAAAVAGADVKIGTAANALGDRLRAGAARVDRAAARHEATEAASADEMTALVGRAHG